MSPPRPECGEGSSWACVGKMLISIERSCPFARPASGCAEAGMSFARPRRTEARALSPFQAQLSPASGTIERASSSSA